mmetsp:Transcript_22693/g.69329  ORF Transcript_22693/g.69329 Transcript_22693/m.69329 type:complete len:223 (-) Transcript_22693:564-1232(-)
MPPRRGVPGCKPGVPGAVGPLRGERDPVSMANFAGSSSSESSESLSSFISSSSSSSSWDESPSSELPSSILSTSISSSSPSRSSSPSSSSSSPAPSPPPLPPSPSASPCSSAASSARVVSFLAPSSLPFRRCREAGAARLTVEEDPSSSRSSPVLVRDDCLAACLAGSASGCEPPSEASRPSSSSHRFRRGCLDDVSRAAASVHLERCAERTQSSPRRGKRV